MRTRHIKTFAETIRTDAVTLALEYLSVRDATEHEFRNEEERAAYAEVLKALGRFQHGTSFPRALAELDVSPEAADAGPQHHLMRSIAWSFGDGATFPGYTDDTLWNGFTNVWVSPSVWPQVLEELIAGADNDAEKIEDYKARGRTEGLISLSHGFATNEVTCSWITCFPDYPIHTMVPIPEGWSEMSWRHEAAPSFGPCVGPMGEAAQIWVDYEHPAMRDVPEVERYTFSRRDAVENSPLSMPATITAKRCAMSR